MQLNFNTENLSRAKAALILYAMFRSRSKNSPLNGLETWNRFTTYIRGSAIKSTNIAEFIQHFCHVAKIQSINPKYLSDGRDFVFMSDGSLIQANNLKDYKLDVLSDDTLILLFEKEGILLTILVRERLQREKAEHTYDEEEENNENQV